MLIIGGSGSGKTNSLFNLVSHQLDIDKDYLNGKDPYEAKYKLLIKNRENTGLKHVNDSKAFIEYSNDVDDIFKNIEEYNPNRKRKILIVFDDMIADMLNNKNRFITQSYFAVTKNVRLNSTHNIITPSKLITVQDILIVQW